MKRAALLFILAACGASSSKVVLTDTWPTTPPPSYDDATEHWTRKAMLRGQYQEVLEIAATFKSPE